MSVQIVAVTASQVRAELTQPYHDAALVLMDEIEDMARKDELYAAQLELWLCGSRSTVFLRDTICEPHRWNTVVVAAAAHFNPTTNWHNTWMPIDSAGHNARIKKFANEGLSDNPFFGMF